MLTTINMILRFKTIHSTLLLVFSILSRRRILHNRLCSFHLGLNFFVYKTRTRWYDAITLNIHWLILWYVLPIFSLLSPLLMLDSRGKTPLCFWYYHLNALWLCIHDRIYANTLKYYQQKKHCMSFPPRLDPSKFQQDQHPPEP